VSPGDLRAVDAHVSLRPTVSQFPHDQADHAIVVPPPGQSKDRLAAQDAATRALAEARSLSEAAPCALQALGRFMGWELGAMWVVDGDREHLRCLDIWHAKGVDASGFRRLSRQATFRLGEGIPGRAWAECQAIWVRDVANMARSQRVRDTASIGLHSAFAFPIELGGEVVGAIEFFSSDVRQPDAERLALIASIGTQLGQYIERDRAQRWARQSAALTRSVLDGALDSVVTIDGAGEIVEWNPAAERTFGHSRDEMVGRPLADVLGPTVPAATGSRALLTARRAGGDEFPAEVAITRVESESLSLFTVWLRDLSEQAEAERTLRLHDSALAAAHSGIVIVSAELDHPIVYVNPAFERITGWRAEDVLGKNPRLLQTDDTDPHTLAAIREGLERGRSVEATLLNRRRDGAPFWNELSISPVRDDDGVLSHFVGVQTDISARRQAEAQIEHLISNDSVTGLSNRAMFMEHLDLSLARAKRSGHALAVLNIDLDSFRLVNDSFGHETGDALLMQTAERLRRVTRAADVVARKGGDEFLVLIADLEPNGHEDHGDDLGDALQITQAIAGQIHHALRAPFDLGGSELFVGATIGIGVYPLDADDREGLLRHAAASVTTARERRSAVDRAPTLIGGDAHRQLSLATRLRHALDRDEFVLHYQPVLNLTAGTMVGVEALIRWNDGPRGLVSPIEFIPFAERLGLIGPISDWVMETAFGQCRTWSEMGLDVDVAINMPPVLWQPALVKKLVAAIERSRVAPSRITIEVTETAVMTDPDRTQRVLAELHSCGVQLAIDDFGTGYSSLSRLKQMPVELLKIDRSFVRDLPHDAEAASIVTAIVQLAKNLGIRPLAEGIETLAQRRFLVEQGCTLGQGFHFSRPVPADEIPATHLRLTPRRAA
jgi:diguanylate cyclase (GGDEF)-like protein/PAS domain S-box-containing protein